MQKKQRLELTWIGKGEKDNPKLEPRILIEDSEKSYGDKNTENILIHGDNLLALKALEQDYAGKVKCIYIDPPYNIKSANPYYQDDFEHSEWLSLMKPRLALLKKLLSHHGVIFVQIDDDEMAYLQVLMDEVFGRYNRVNTIAVKMSEASGVKMAHVSKRLAKLKEYILVYKKDITPDFDVEKIPLGSWNDEYKTILFGVTAEELDVIKELMNKDSCNNDDILTANNILKKCRLESCASYFKVNGIQEKLQEKWKYENAWRIIQAVGSSSVFALAKAQPKMEQSIASLLSNTGLLYLYKTDFDRESKQPRVQVIFADNALMIHPGDFWVDIRTTGGVGQEGGVLFPNGKKPEQLISRIIKMSTQKGDLILDSFLGSGTTAAVAHKMGRRWIGIELGEHCHTHCIPRLQKVIDGTDQGGISKAANWQGGGGFKYYYLAPSLLKKDKFGNWVIEEQYNADMLAAAMAKQEGFRYSPDSALYWKQGFSNEFDFICTTTQFLTVEMLDSIHSEMKSSETLLIACKSFQDGCNKRYPNINIKKIPSMLLGRCEFGKEDYSLNILSLPEIEDSAEDDE